MSRRSEYSEQFRRAAVELVTSGDRPLPQVARELGVNHETLRSWVDTAKQETVADEVARLRKQVAELEKETEILRKATGYFAREMDR
ncbi:transposase [Amycolatopsis sp. NPDC004747]